MALTGEATLPRSGVGAASRFESVLPVDWLLAAYNSLLVVLWLGVAPADRSWLVTGLHVAGVFLPLLLARLPTHLPRPVRILRELYPLVVLPLYWIEIDALFPLRHSGTFDAWIYDLEQAIFGMQLAETWMPSAPQPWFSEVMYFSYFIYYAAVYLAPIIMILAARTEAGRDMVLRLMAAYLVCYVIYHFFPVDGPHFLHEPFQGEHQNGFFYGLVQTTQESGDSRGCAFPSSHVAGAVTAAYLAFRWLPRWLAWVLTVEALGVVLSTVYTQSHYALDSIVAAAGFIGFQLLVVSPILRRMGHPARDELWKPPGAEAERLAPVVWTKRRWAS